MIREHHENIPDDYRVAAPAVLPWVRFPACQKCGHTLGAGIPLLALLCQAKGEAAQNYTYCLGDQNSTVPVTSLNPATGEIRPAMVQTACFGIFHDHLHLACSRCGYRWLMAVRGEVL